MARFIKICVECTLKEAVPMFRATLRGVLFCLLMAALSGVSPAQSFTLDLPLQSRPVRYFQPGPFGGNEPQNGTFCCEGPHYPAPHTWYATCTAKDGVIVKVK
jgi:hypothetical protein